MPWYKKKKARGCNPTAPREEAVGLWLSAKGRILRVGVALFSEVASLSMGTLGARMNPSKIDTTSRVRAARGGCACQRWRHCAQNPSIWTRRPRAAKVSQSMIWWFLGRWLLSVSRTLESGPGRPDLLASGTMVVEAVRNPGI